jgi:cytochrome c oxidase subunit 4
MTGHIVSRWTYFAVSVALALLLVLTVAASYVNLGAFNIVVAIGIATAKAVLIVLFFMHVIHSPPLVRLAAVAGFVWLGIMLVLLLADYAARGWLE